MTNTKRAYELGRKARQEEKSAASYQNKEIMKMLEGNKVGEGLPILQAFNKGWHEENAKIARKELGI